MEFKQTAFKLVHFRHDQEVIKMVLDLDNSGAHIMTNEAPTFTPAIAKGKYGNIPLAYLTIEWVNNSKGQDGTEVIYHEVHDTRQFNPKNYTYEDIRATVARSFDAMNEQYDELCEQIGIQGDIHQPTLDEFESYCHSIERFLKEQVG